MSLSYEAFRESSNASDRWRKRLVELLGYGHYAITDHYDCMHLYNQSIFAQMSDEEILAIHERFLRWQEKILAVFAEYGAAMDEAQLKSLFDTNRMQGSMYFLNVRIDIDAEMDIYRPAILNFLEAKKP